MEGIQMTVPLRFPRRFADYLASIVALAVFVGLVGLGAGVSIGYRWGERQTARALQPDIDANAAEIAVLTDRLIYLRDAVQMETLASYYGEDHRGKLTASGEPFNPDELTAASPWLPFGSVWVVTHIGNGRSVRVRITDRGPHPRLGRGIDLSTAAARKIGMIRDGVAKVKITPEI
jgi:rare lipoprotein A